MNDILEAISKMPDRPISASGLNRKPQNIYIYSYGYDSAPSLTSNYFSIFETASILILDVFYRLPKNDQ